MTFRPRTNTKAAAAAAVASFLVVSLWLLGCCSCSSFVIVVRDCQDCRVGFWLLTADGKLLIDLLSLSSFFLSLSIFFFSLCLSGRVSVYIFILGNYWGHIGEARGERKKEDQTIPEFSVALRQKDLFFFHVSLDRDQIVSSAFT